MSRSMFSRRGVWVLFVLFGLIPYCIGADGFCTPVSTTPTDTGQNGNTDTGQPIPTVNGAPRIVFSAPAVNSTYSVGDSVVVTLTANDPENDFDWSLFYDRDGVFNGNEAAIQSGSRTGSSLVQAVWSTQGLEGGAYFMWALVTDSGGNTDRTSVGPINLASAAVAGTIRVTSPASSVAVTVGNAVSVVFAAVNAPTGSNINVFYDTDDNFSNGIAGNVAVALAPTATSASWNTTGITAGVYYLGASLGVGSSGRVAAYAPGQVTVSTSTVPGSEDLTGLELTLTAPSGIVAVNKGAAIPIQFVAKDTQGGATVDLYYVQVGADGSTPAYTGNETKIVSGLSVSATNYTWTVNLDPGVYRVGGSIGRTATLRLPSVAPGKVQVTTAGGGGGGGGGGGTTYTVAIEDPADVATPIAINRLGSHMVRFIANASGTVRLYYALDNDKNKAPDAGNNWVAFTALINSSLGKGSFSPASIGLTSGTYAIKAVFHPAEFDANDLSHNVEDIKGWIGIEQLVIVAPPTPPVEAIQIDRSKTSSKVTFGFTLTNPVAQAHTFVLSTRSSPVSTTEVPIVVTPAFSVTSTPPVTQTDLVGTQLLSGLNFLRFWHMEGSTPADQLNVTSPIYVYDGASQSKLTDPISVFAPNGPDLLFKEGDEFEVTWFVSQLPTIAGDASVTLFCERVNDLKQPTGERADLKEKGKTTATVYDPLGCYAKISTDGVPFTYQDLLVGAKYTYTQSGVKKEAVGYAPSLIRVKSANDRSILVTTPAQNQIIRVGQTASIGWTFVDPTNQARVNIFYDRDGVFDGNEVFVANDLALGSSPYTLNTATANMPAGLYFVGATIDPVGATTHSKDYADYATGSLLVLPTTTPTPGFFTVLTPAAPADTTYVTLSKNRPMNVTWFVKSGAIPSTDFVTVFAEPVSPNGTPAGAGTRTYFKKSPSQDPFQFSPSVSVCPFPVSELTGSEYFFGAIYQGSTTVTAYAPAKVRFRDSIWMGDVSGQYVSGAVFEGVNYFDLAGSSMCPIADINSDGINDFVVVSQFGKPGWDDFGVDGASVGEAYVIFGGPQLGGRSWKLNATGVAGSPDGLAGFVITGLQTLPAIGAIPAPTRGDRGGILGVMPVRDQDSDGRPELIMSFADVNSDSENAGLARAGQFKRGGFVEISSRNSNFSAGGGTFTASQVGQNFGDTCVTDRLYGDFYGCKSADPKTLPNDCSVCCVKEDGPYGAKEPDCKDEKPLCYETILDHGLGFSKDLAAPWTFPIWMNDPFKDACLPYGLPKAPCECPSFAFNNQIIQAPGCGISSSPPTGEMSTGFLINPSQEPYGMRMIGEADNDRLAWSMSTIDGLLLVSAPNSGITGPQDGIGYRMALASTPPYGYPGFDWEPGPRPYQYLVGGGGYCSTSGPGFGAATFFNSASSDPGRGQEHLGTAISGLPDFNGDALGDVAIGAPDAFAANGSGAVYVVYRRIPALDTDRDLKAIELGQSEGGRKVGLLIRGRAGEHLGDVVGVGADIDGDGANEKLDMNHDGRPDLVLGNWRHDSERGEVVIVFGNPNFESPVNGFSIDDLLNHQDGLGNPAPLATVIRGETQGDNAGYNISYAGDFDGDGTADLLIAAPSATAHVDTNGDGVLETLADAGKVYLILGSNMIQPGDVLDLSMVGKADGNGKKGIKGLVFSGHHANDTLGGGAATPYSNGAGDIGTTGVRARSITWAGDANADGLSDLLVGAPMASVTSTGNPVARAGEVYLIFGFPVPY